MREMEIINSSATVGSSGGGGKEDANDQGEGVIATVADMNGNGAEGDAAEGAASEQQAS